MKLSSVLKQIKLTNITYIAKSPKKSMPPTLNSPDSAVLFHAIPFLSIKLKAIYGLP